MRVLVIGAGIAGLAAAHRVLELEPMADVVVLEVSDRPGGMLRTERIGELIVDCGPDSILTTTPAAIDLARRVGLNDEIIRTQRKGRGVYVVCRGVLERVPSGFVVAGTCDLESLVRSPILSPQGKARAVRELHVPVEQRDDESVRSFVQRRYGCELFERLAQPMIGGIYGGDLDRLSMHAVLGRFVGYEIEYGSVTAGLRARVAACDGEANTGARYGKFINFVNGMQSFSEAVARRLGSRIRLGTSVNQILPHRRGWCVALDDGETEEATHVIVALPAPMSAKLVEGFDPTLASELAAIEYSSCATVAFAWKKTDVSHPLDAFGFVVPAIEQRRVLACTWSSVKWPGRAPSDQVLLRVFLDHESVFACDDSTLIEAARIELADLIGIKAKPLATILDRHIDSMPRYGMGHKRRVDRIERYVCAHTYLQFVGNAYRGVGIPDTIGYAEQAAEEVCCGVWST